MLKIRRRRKKNYNNLANAVNKFLFTKIENTNAIRRHTVDKVTQVAHKIPMQLF